ncbi:uncharacterized protein LOC129255339 [Lytechinus pictus]|uniref:uncharacterized protein LOC129255339 n=1 Tax=Lytechinus pictus TaxID=7653 RepID=UPI0030B9C285
MCPYTMKARERSCFCTACRKGEQCPYEEISGKWKTVKLIGVKCASNIADNTESTTGDLVNEVQPEPTAQPEPTPETEPADQVKFNYGDYVEVNFAGGSTQPKNFIGLIETLDEPRSEVEVSFMRSKEKFYVWPYVVDRSWVHFNAVVRKLQPPSINSHGHHVFAEHVCSPANTGITL